MIEVPMVWHSTKEENKIVFPPLSKCHLNLMQVSGQIKCTLFHIT